MAKHRILIVDDQPDVRRVLRAAIESLGPEYEVLDLPSAEEAILVHTIQNVDLLVADIRLPGMSGFELMEKVNRRKTNARVILITGLDDNKLRDRVSQAGAFAAFFKPIAMKEFLQAVQEALGVLPTDALRPGSAGFEAQTLPESQQDDLVAGNAAALLGCLASLMISTNAFAAALLDGKAGIIEQTGDIPKVYDDIKPELASLFSYGNRISTLLKAGHPETLFCIAGPLCTLFFAQVSEDRGVCLFTGPDGSMSPVVSDTLLAAANDMKQILEASETRMPKKLEDSTGSTSAQPDEQNQELIDITEEDLDTVAAIFDPEVNKGIEGIDLNVYWDSLVEQSEQHKKTGSLSYDEASQLGLAPHEDH
jgi:CheY-like chemotaxis protein